MENYDVDIGEVDDQIAMQDNIIELDEIAEDGGEIPDAVDCDPVDTEDVEHDAEEEAEPQRSMSDPGKPSLAQIKEHDLTHIPMRPWCRHCVRGKAKDKASLRICGAYSENLRPRVRLDYCFLTDNSENVDGDQDGDLADGATTADADGPAEETIVDDEQDAGGKASATVLVMQESECRSVWAYQVEHKGASEEWVINQITEDLETVGLKNDRIILKSDQESSATEVAKAIAKCRVTDFGSAVETSAVGDSDSNGTIERAIQDVEGQVRTLRSALEEKVAMRIRLGTSIVPWLIRHAAYLITRCRVRPSGHTSLQMMKGRRPNSKLAEFAEVVHFKIPNTKLTPGKYEDLWKDGLWLGCDARSGENLIGTDVGVFKVATVRRKPEDERWSAFMIIQMTGSPKTPVPGQATRRMPAYSNKYTVAPPMPGSAVPQPSQPAVDIRNWKIYREDVVEHGATDGCPGCRAAIQGVTTRAGHQKSMQDKNARPDQCQRSGSSKN